MATSLMALAGCVVMPAGPSVMALPGSGKNFEQFRVDDARCRDYAYDQIGGETANQAATDSAVASAALGTVVGAVAGAAIGGHEGAGVGAGTGLVVGGLAGSGAAQRSAYGSQRRYDGAYVQCMYSKGHRVPVAGRFAEESGRRAVPRSRDWVPPPPPPGSPPPPPPDAD